MPLFSRRGGSPDRRPCKQGAPARSPRGRRIPAAGCRCCCCTAQGPGPISAAPSPRPAPRAAVPGLLLAACIGRRACRSHMHGLAQHRVTRGCFVDPGNRRARPFLRAGGRGGRLEALPQRGRLLAAGRGGADGMRRWVRQMLPEARAVRKTVSVWRQGYPGINSSVGCRKQRLSPALRHALRRLSCLRAPSDADWTPLDVPARPGRVGCVANSASRSRSGAR